jgi:2-phospho-L-lactate guanylyltransferase
MGAMAHPTRERGPTAAPSHPFRSLAAIIPIRSLETAKSRLGGPLDAEERQALVRELLERTIRAALDARGVARVLVVSDDEENLRLARILRAEAVLESGHGLNRALVEARRLAVDTGAEAVLALPADLPRVDAAAIEAIVSVAREALAAGGADRPCVVLVPDRHGEGTNALLLTPPDVIPFAFGVGSRHRHARLAAEAGASYREILDGPLSLDLDTPDDLLLAEAVAGPAAVESDG